MITSIRLVPLEWCIMGSGEIGKEIEPLFCGVYLTSFLQRFHEA